MIFKQLIAGTLFDIRRRQNAVFWVSQIAVVCSTILGVYLAASAGLKTAIDFHSVTSVEKNFYTLSALREEVQGNNDLVLAFAKTNFVYNDEDQIVAHRSGRAPEFNWYVWTTMSNITETLELPVDILQDTNRYYIELTRAVAAYDNSAGRDKLFAARRVDKVARDAQLELFGRMDAQIKAYQARLENYKNLGQY